MANNDFLPFAGGAGANVIDQPTYAALTALLANGFSSGTAQSAQLNKVWRQSSILAAVVAQMIVDNTGQNATDDGTTATLLANLKSAVAGRLINCQVFTASGTYTATPGTKSVVVEVIGGGGAGGGAVATSAGQGSIGGGGWSGAFAKGRITSGFSGVSVTIGNGGTGVSGAPGNSGGTSSFGALISSPGGPGGASSLASSTLPLCQGASLASMSPATGGSIVNAPGNPPVTAIIPNLNSCASGLGGSSPYGGGGYGITFGSSPQPGSGRGAGGGGAANGPSSSASTGGAGSAGMVIVWEFA